MVTSQDKLDAVFAALSDPTRRRILERLSRRSDIQVTELARPFKMSLPAISRHLRVLEDARLISRQRQGRVHRIRPNEAGLNDARKWIARYARFWETRFEAMDQLLERQNKPEDKKKS